MASKPIFLGNITAILLTLLAFLQIIPWSLIGLMILAALIMPLLFSRQSNNPGTTRATTRGLTTAHQATPEPKTHRQHDPEKAPIHKHPATPNYAPPKTLPGTGQQKRCQPDRTPTHTPEPVRVEAISSQKPSTTKPVLVKPGPGGLPPVNSAIISEGDYQKYEVELKEGDELVSEVKATGTVNVYLLDQDNLTSLDMGEEFWQETGEESVKDTTIHFTSPSTGKWFLVVENADFKEITATVDNRIT